MKHLHWIIADLFLPPHVLLQVSVDLQLPYLQKLLARGKHNILPARAQEDLLCEAFGTNAAAPLRAQADGLSVQQFNWLCADPVDLQLQQSQAILQANVACSEAEAFALCVSLNAHFNQDGLTFFAAHPQRWYVRVEVLGEVLMHPISSVMQRDVKAYLPQGADALRWQKVVNEVQMLLHGHAVNVARESNGLPPINSLWLWGGGTANPLDSVLDAVGGDMNLSAAFAQLTQVVQPASLVKMLGGQAQQGLWGTTTLSEAWRNDDLYAWRERLKVIENEMARPIWEALCAGNLASVTVSAVDDSALRTFELQRSDCWKLWRRAKPLAHYAV